MLLSLLAKASTRTAFAWLLIFSGIAAALWPIPATYRHGNEVVWIDSDTKWIFDSPDGLDRQILAKVNGAIGRARSKVLTNQLVPWKLRPHGEDFDPDLTGRRHSTIKRVVIQQLKKDESKTPDYGEQDESYQLHISGTGGVEVAEIAPAELTALYTKYGKGLSVFIIANHSDGILHALTTLHQLFYQHSGNPLAIYTPLAPVVIKDAPRFAHRGLNLDVARQWYPKEAILKVLEGMAWNKLNRFHFHVTDSQSWPLEVPALPELATKGAYFRGLTYSTKDIQDIYQYAADRGIQVIMEIDMPGHTSSIGHAYPELITGQNSQPLWTQVAAQPPSGHLKLNNKAVDDFLTKLFNDLVPRLTKYSKYFHTGGDEVNKNIYLLDPGINSNQTSVIKPHLQKFIEHAHALVRKNGASPVVWEEMVVEWGLDLPKDVIVQTWLGDESVKTAASKGHRVIAGTYQYWYLDCGNGQWLDFTGQQGFPYNDWCGPKKSWRLIYTYDPTQGLTPAEAALVLGGEVHLWSEQIDAHSLDSTLWPRASAAAEVLWSGRTTQDGKNRTFAEASPRLAEVRERMVGWRIEAAPVMQLWCHQHEGDCEMPGQ